LIKEGRIKKQEPLPEISEGERPFELPVGWEWARPNEFSQKITDGEHFRPPTQHKGVYFLSAKDIRSEGVSFDDPLFVDESVAKKALQRCNPGIGDLLIVSRGATIGRVCIVDTEQVFCLLGSVILIKPMMPMLSQYLRIIMTTPHAFGQLISASGSTAQPAIYIRDIKKILFPIAPLAEQHRIVAKVGELLTLCDTLKARLKDAHTTQVHLADAIVEHATAS
jgi:type I restriction enzyme S subunit